MPMLIKYNKAEEKGKKQKTNNWKRNNDRKNENFEYN